MLFEHAIKSLNESDLSTTGKQQLKSGELED